MKKILIVLFLAGMTVPAIADKNDFIFKEFETRAEALKFIEAVDVELGYKDTPSGPTADAFGYYRHPKTRKWIVEVLDIFGTRDAINPLHREKLVTKESISVIKIAETSL